MYRQSEKILNLVKIYRRESFLCWRPPFPDKSGDPARTRLKRNRKFITEITLTAWFYQKQQMAELEQAVKKIDAKLRMLKFTTEEVPRIREKKELKALERLQKDLEKQLDGVHEQKVQIQALKIEQGDDPNDVREWTLEIEGQVDVFEKLADNVRVEARNLREEALRELRDEEEKKEEEKRNRRYEEELKFEEAKLKVKRDHEKKLEEDRNKSLKESGAKLPKLTITKFQGTHLG